MILKRDKVVKLCLDSFSSGSLNNFYLERRKSNWNRMIHEQNEKIKQELNVIWAVRQRHEFQYRPCLNVSVCPCQTLYTQPSNIRLGLGILKGEVSLYCWLPVGLVWNQLFDNWQFLFFICKTDLSKQVKQEISSTVILSPLVFPD